MAQKGKNLPVMQETQVLFLGRDDPLEKEVATHSSILVWRIPWTEKPGGYSPYSCKESDTTEATWQAHVQCIDTCFLTMDRTHLLEGRPAAGMSCCERTPGLTQAHVLGTLESGGAEWGLPLPH